MRFPVFALIAPILTSVILWLVTGSAYTLLFALLGPVMALAQFADGKLQAKRADRLKQELDEELETARLAELSQKSLYDQRELLLKHPAVSSYAHPGHATRPPWAASASPGGDRRVVRIGVAVRGGEPVLVDINRGIAVTGNALEVRSAIRALGFQLLWHWGDSEFSRVQWNLPEEKELVEFQPAVSSAQQMAVYAWSSEEPLPAGVTFTLSVEQGRAVLRNVVDPAAEEIFLFADLLTRAEANRILSVLCQEREAMKRATAPGTALPAMVPALVNLEGPWESSRTSLLAIAGRDHKHPVMLDLVTVGPHAVITGMTGSGKTEFLRAWLASLMSTYSPQHLSVLVLDYKGGAGFASLNGSPHLVGVITDLQPARTQRAVTSLRAELRYREEVLAQAGVPDISELPEGVNLPRLLVLVDEYRAMIEVFPELAHVFVDLASRGRSLGIHLILASQRTGGLLSDALLANCALRISFRVTDKQDSHALFGVDAAAALEHIPGRAVVQGTGMELRVFQSAYLDQGTNAAVSARATGWRALNPDWSPHIPWKPELPAELTVEDMPEEIAGVSWLGLVDIPEVQEQSWAHYAPAREGNLVITGPARSGVSRAVRMIYSQLQSLLLSDSEIAWDAVVKEPHTTMRSNSVVLIDDLDELLGHYGLEHREQFIESLVKFARMAPQRSSAVVIGCTSQIRGVQSLLDLFPHKLEMTDSHKPGRGVWRGHEIQVLHSAEEPESSGAWEQFTCEPENSYVIISHRSTQLRANLATRYGQRVCSLTSDLLVSAEPSRMIVVGTPEEWMMNPQKLFVMKATSILVLDGCAPSEVRGLRLRPGLMPHVENDTALVVEPDGSTTRAVLEI